LCPSPSHVKKANQINQEEKMFDKEKIKSAYDMTDEEVAKSIDLETSDFDESGDMLDELRDIMEGNDV